ncbi:hypothetical protein DXG01_009164 [Tephrocybe rancida]|nr:hypothetical protein DXG01_009164 [Tephrocybe rancida]
MLFNPSPTAAALLAVFSIGIYTLFKRPSKAYPPGPPSIPLFGNLLHFKPSGGWTQLLEHKSTYGDLIFFHGLGQYILVLNTLEAIDDLLEKRWKKYSDRPILTVACELVGLGKTTPMLPYGKTLRDHRKMLHSALSTSATKNAAGRLILSIAYGLKVKDAEDKYIKHSDESMAIVGRALVLGTYLCDVFPIRASMAYSKPDTFIVTNIVPVKHLPSWVPFRREAAHGRYMILKHATMPFEHVKRTMAEGTAAPSLAQDLLLQNPGGADTAEYDELVLWSCGSTFAAGSDTTYATLQIFILAMALNPSKLHLAQSEIDHVIGTDRLPSIADLPKLPYVAAVIKECMRWHPAVPLGLPRLTAEDDTYRGYFIPKNTIVIPNVWALAFQPNSKYPETQFLPERFLDLDPEHKTMDPAVWAFGFARRACPGKALAESSLTVMILTIIAAFDIGPLNDGSLCYVKFPEAV